VRTGTSAVSCYWYISEPFTTVQFLWLCVLVIEILQKVFALLSYAGCLAMSACLAADLLILLHYPEICHLNLLKPTGYVIHQQV
jgi:hypothetical protein